MIAPLMFLISLFADGVSIYETNNNAAVTSLDFCSA